MAMVEQSFAGRGKRALTVWLAVADADDRPDYSVQGGYLFMPREGDTWTAQVAITWPRAPWARRGIGARVAGARQGVEAARARHAALEKEMRLAVRCMSSGAGTRRFGRIDSR